MNRHAPHYGLRVPSSLLPVVEVTTPRQEIRPGGLSGWEPYTYDHVLKRFRGVNMAHAMKRARRWMRDHGDPR